MKLAVLVLVVSTSIAYSAPSKAVATADAWLKAMLDGSAKLEKGKTLPYVVDSKAKPCKKLKTGTVKTEADFKALKACVFGNRDLLSKDAKYTIAERVPAKDDGDPASRLKTVPKGAVLVDGEYQMGPQFATFVMAVKDNAVVVLWVYFAEPEDTFGE